MATPYIGVYAPSYPEYVLGSTTPAPVNEVDVTLALGQSNMLGVGDKSHFQDPARAVYTERGELTQSFANELIYDYANATPGYYALNPGVNNVSLNYPNQAQRAGLWFGAELGLSTRYRAMQPTRKLYIIKVPIDGQPLTSYNAGTNAWNILSAAIAATNTYLAGLGKTPKYSVLLVHGEADFSNGNNNYAADLEVFFNRIRAINGLAANGRIVVSGVRSQGEAARAAWAIAQQKAFVDADPTNRRYIDTEGYTVRADVNDTLHYDAAAQYQLGNRDAYNRLFDTTGGWVNPGAGTTPPASTELTVAYTNANYFFLTPWADNGTGKSIANADTFAGLTFNGTAVYFDLERGLNNIKQDVYMDGEFKGTLELASGAAEPLTQRFAVTGLSAGTHQLKLVSRAGYTSTFALLQRVRITAGQVLAYTGGSDYPQLSVLENTSNSFTYGFGWNAFDVPKASGGSLHYTSPGEANATPTALNITGTGFDYWAPRWGFDCRTKIYCDNDLVADVVVAAGDEISTVRFSTSSLSPGAHTLRFENVPGTNTMGIIDKITTH